MSAYQPDKYVACTYDDQWHIGNNVERSDINSDVLVTFMKHSNTKLSWLRQEDNCWVPLQHILCTTDVPQPALLFVFDPSVYKNLVGHHRFLEICF